MFSRRHFLRAGLAALAGSSASLVSANAPAVSLRPVARTAAMRGGAVADLDALLAGSGLKGKIACAVANVETGKSLEAEGGEVALPPASVAKALTALYALDVLGAEHRFSTQVLADGDLRGGILHGDLILAGGGDSTLNTDHLALLARSLKEAGVREVRGDFKVWDGALASLSTIDPGQPDHVGYSPAISGIALNFNRVHFQWKRASKGWSISMDARTEKYRPEVSMARMTVKNRALPVYTYADEGDVDSWSVASQALGQGGSRWLPVRHPGHYAGDVFRTMARAQGIVLRKAKVTGRMPQARLLAHHQSPPLRVMLKAMLKYSNNLMAEMIGMSATAALSGRPASLKTSAAQMTAWAARTYGVTNSRLVDHSGLGDASRMTPNDMVAVLIAAHRQGQLKTLLKPFRMRDSNGRVMKAHPIKVVAKTGTLNFVSGLGGFLTATDGTELAFAIFAADSKARARIKRADRERPPGARSWNRRAKVLQQKLIERWGQIYGS